MGDVNKDGIINIKDATHIQMYLAEYSGYPVTLELADVNKDKKITVTDVTALQRIIAEYY